MMVLIVGISLALSLAAVVMAFGMATRWGQWGWLALALTLLVSALRRGYSLWALLVLRQGLDPVSEGLGLIFALLALTAVLGLRWRQPSQDATRRTPETLLRWPISRLTRWALALLSLAILGSLGVGLYSYSASRHVLLARLQRHNTVMAQLLAAEYAAETKNSSPARALQTLRSVWDGITQPPPARYLILIGPDGRTLWHSAVPEPIDQPSGQAALPSTGRGPSPLADRLGTSRPWTGTMLGPQGRPLTVALAPVPARGGFVGVAATGARLETDALHSALPWVAGFGIIVLALFPASFLTLRRAYFTAHQALLDTAQALHDSEERYRALFENSHAAMVVLDPDRATIVDSNPAACAFYGYDRARLCGMGIAQIDPGDAARIPQRVHACLAGTQPQFVTRQRMASGADREVEVSCGPMAIQGRTFLFAIVHDVTERRRVQEQLELIRRAVASASDAVGLTDPEGRVIYHNQAMTDLLGYSIQEINNCGGPRVVFPPTPAAQAVYRARQERPSYCTEVELRARDGRDVPVLYRTDRITDSEGRTIGQVTVLTDMTERRRADQALRQSQETLATMMQHLPGMAYRCAHDAQWTMEFVSEGCLDLTGYQPSDLLHNRRIAFNEIVHPADRARLHQVVDAAVREDRGYELTYRIITATGRQKWVWEQGRAVRSHRGTLVALEGFLADVTQQHEAEDRIRASEARFRELVDHIDEAFWLVDPASGRFIYASPALSQITARPLPDGHTSFRLHIEALTVPEDRPAVRQYLTNILAGAQAGLEFRLTCPDGGLLWVLARAFPVRDEQGAVCRIAGTLQDITLRRQAEEALRESERKYRQLFTEMLDGLALHEIICDSEGRPIDYRFLEVNPAFERMTGWSAAQVVGRTMRQILPDIEPFWIDTYGRVALGGQPTHFEHFVPQMTRHFEVAAFSPRLGLFAAMFTDVTARQQAETDLRRAYELLDAVIRTCPVPVFTIGPDGRVDLWNPAAEKTFGWTQQEVRGRPLPIVPEVAYAEHHFLLQRVMQGEALRGIEVRRVRRDGSPVDISIFNAPIRDHQGAILSIVSVTPDISERKLGERALRASEEKSRDLAARLQVLLRELDHRVKNNLAALYALVERYARSAQDVASFAAAIRGKLMAMNAAHEIIARAGWQPVDIAELLGGLAAQLTADPHQRLALHLEGPPLRIVPRQASALAMVLQELVANCEKHGAFRSPQGTVNLTWLILPESDLACRVRLRWQETGGPPAQSPAGQGVGLKLIDGFARFELGGQATFDFTPQGLTCILDCQLDISLDSAAAPA